MHLAAPACRGHFGIAVLLACRAGADVDRKTFNLVIRVLITLFFMCDLSQFYLRASGDGTGLRRTDGGDVRPG